MSETCHGFPQPMSLIKFLALTGKSWPLNLPPVSTHKRPFLIKTPPAQRTPVNTLHLLVHLYAQATALSANNYCTFVLSP